jgi:hypothetical protein
VEPPVISGVEPLMISAGGELTLTGSGFAPEAGENNVRFDGVQGRVLSASPTQLRVEVPLCVPSRTANVTASLGAVSSAARVVAVSGTNGTTLDLQPGQVRTLTTAAEFACVRLPAEARADYLMVVHNAAGRFGPRLPFEARTLTPGQPAATMLASPAPADVPLQYAWESALRRREAAYGAAERVPDAFTVASVPAVGSRRSFNVLNRQQEFQSISATARLVTQRAVLYVDDDAESAMMDQDLSYFGQLFEDPIFPTLTGVFGEPGDIDSNQRVIVLFTPVVNQLTPRGSSTFVTGFFYGCDLVSQNRCSGTNRGEILYSMVPDGEGRWGDVRTRTQVRAVVPPVIAHELQHLLHFGRRNSTTDALWLNEGLAHMAEEIVADVFASRGEVPHAQQFAAGNHDRARLFLHAPAATAVLAEDLPGTLEMRGGAWLLVKYLRGHYGGDDLLRRITVSSRNGTDNIAHEVGRPWASIMADFGVALWTSGLPDLQGVLEPRHTFANANLRTLLSPGAAAYPLQPSSLGWQDFAVFGMVNAGTHAYFRVANTVDVPPPLNLVLSGMRGAAFPAGTAPAVSFLRVR